MDRETYNHILLKYNISGNPSLEELAKIIRNKAKNFHPDKHVDDSPSVREKYENIFKEIWDDHEIVVKMAKNKYVPSNSGSRTSSTNSTQKSEHQKSVDELKKDVSTLIEKLKVSYNGDEHFLGTLGVYDTLFKECNSQEEFNKTANRFKRDLFLKRLHKFTSMIGEDRLSFREDGFFGGPFSDNVISKYKYELEELERLAMDDPSLALSKLKDLKARYKIDKQNYINSFSKASSSKK